ncbi:hypothetical protein [Acinetobacter sp. MD2(2019)]|uniref:hypothetical protein n=1 Tax=Acinetobacter sp. MD2(2019) TaxID=2605273 RepID=UPI002D1EED53|nr:hypothetical protein [Acinetobacter sp. MD2(2019)]MEB3753956.1 hypothetical protein [Acinetobacter sp. MD2(2019)]
MKLFLDCEFNGFNGPLISLALVDTNKNYFYEVLACNEPIPWVKDNVIPKLNQEPINYLDFQAKLQAFLFNYDSIHIIADWPEDIALFLNALMTQPGQCIQTPPLTMQIWKPTNQNSIIVSKNPHNALSDALALLENYTREDKT